MCVLRATLPGAAEPHSLQGNQDTWHAQEGDRPGELATPNGRVRNA